jgi:hypothetical protein
MRSRLLSPVLLLLALATLGAPGVAAAQQMPKLGSPSPEETAPAPATTSDTADEGLDTWQQALIFAAGVVLLGGIAAAIVGDARRRAGRGRHPARAGRDARGRLRLVEDRAADHRHRQAGKQRARQRARAARTARKRNR